MVLPIPLILVSCPEEIMSGRLRLCEYSVHRIVRYSVEDVYVLMVFACDHHHTTPLYDVYIRINKDILLCVFTYLLPYVL